MTCALMLLYWMAPGDARLAKPISKPHMHLRASCTGLICWFGLYWIALKVAGTTTHVWQIWLTSITQTLQTCIKPINAAKTRKHRRLGFRFNVLRLKLVKLVKQLYPKYRCFLYLIQSKFDPLSIFPSTFMSINQPKYEAAFLFGRESFWYLPPLIFKISLKFSA